MQAENAEKLAFYLLKAISKAHRLYRLFEAGDRIAVAVSGGKDSATLLELLRRWQGKPRFQLVAVHVMAQEAPCGGAIAPSLLRAWFDDLGIESIFVPLEPANQRPARQRQGPCFHCAWRRRKAIFLAAKQMECNKVALAHHADDVAVTTLLNLVYQGRCETMPARLEMFGGALTLIRPLYLVEERDIIRFAHSGIFPFQPTSCALAKNTQRVRMAAILRLIEEENPKAKRSLLNAVERIAATQRIPSASKACDENE